VVDDFGNLRILKFSSVSNGSARGFVAMWIDTHCHLPSLTADANVVLADARASGVEQVVCVGTDVVSSRASVVLAAANDDVWATVGLHPHDAKDFDVAWPAIERLVTAPRVVAVGETGLDFHYNYSPVDAQLASFRRHVELARDRDLALVVHVRDAWEALFAVFAELGAPPRTVIHCFTGGPEELDAALGFGCSISFSGIVSFKNAEPVRAAARACPSDRLLVETDAPYLAPVPHRGEENRPAYVAAVGAALAAVREQPVEELAALTSANARSMFRLPDPRI
jgi:TatD DNase family protein